MTWDVAVTSLGLVGVICAIVFGYLAFRRNEKIDSSDEGQKEGVLFTEIGYIKSGVDDIKRRQEKQDDLYVELAKQMAALESSAKQAHHRIDGIEEKFNKLGGI